MMIVPNYVGPSEIEGVGVFADAHIKAGQPIWLLDERFDPGYTMQKGRNFVLAK